MDFSKIYPPEKYVKYLDNTTYAGSVIQMYRYLTPFLTYRLNFEKWYMNAVSEMTNIMKANDLVGLVKYISDTAIVMHNIQNIVKYGYYKLGNSCGINKVMNKMKEVSKLYADIVDENKHILPKQPCLIHEVYNGLRIEDGKLINIETINFEDKPYGIPAHLCYLELDKLDGVNPYIAGILETINATPMVINFIKYCDALSTSDVHRLYIVESNVANILRDIPTRAIQDMLDTTYSVINNLDITNIKRDDLYYLQHAVKEIRIEYSREKDDLSVSDDIEKLVNKQQKIFDKIEAKLRF